MSEKKKLPGLITGLVAMIATAVFLILGLTTGRWQIVWMVFLIIPITAIVLEAVTSKKKMDSLIGLVALLAVVVFLLLGFFANLWHIAWIVFLVIPITAIIVNIVKTAKKELHKDEQSDETKEE